MPKIKEKNKRQCNHCAKYFDEKTIEGAVHLASCRVYNGWKNYETWNVALWLDNDQSSYSYWREVAKECKKAAEKPHQYLTKEEHTRFLLAARLQDEVREQAEEGIKGMAADLLGAAFDEVDWHAIAENMLEE